MIALNKLIKVTPSSIRKNALNVAGQITKVKNKIDRQRDEPYKLVKAKARDKDGVRRLEYRLYGTGTIKSKAWVSCTCPYFLYFCEVALAAKGSATIKHSNGERPKIRNPRMIPWLCKHLVSQAKQAAQSKE